MRAVVVGASSGLGRCIALGLAKRGAQVALLARRVELLEGAAEEAGPDSVAIACDATDRASCQAALTEAAERLGGIDGLVYAPGVGPLVRLADLDSETWHRAFDTNVVGASLVTAAALPHLEKSSGVAAYLSSVSASHTPPWPGLAAYGVTKAALERLVEAWRSEHPTVGFTRVVVGECMGGEGDATTQFSTGWDPDLAGELLPVWMAKSYMTGGILDVEDLVNAVDTVLRCGATASISSISVLSRPPA